MSSNTQDHSVIVARLYVALFGRAPDAEGLAFWVHQLEQGQSVTSVANTMLATGPAQALYPQGMSGPESVTQLYVQVLGRQPDTEGLDFWTHRLEELSGDLGTLVDELINVVVHYTPPADPQLAALGQHSKDLFENRVEVGVHFASKGGPIDKAAAVLATVTDAASSVEAGKAWIDTLMAGPSPTPTPTPSPAPEPEPEPEPPSYITIVSQPGRDEITLTGEHERVVVGKGVTGAYEQSLVTFTGLVAGQSVILPGHSVVAHESLTARQVAAIVRGADPGINESNWTGSNWWADDEVSVNTQVKFLNTSQGFANLPDMAVGVEGTTESALVIFADLLAGQAITVGGRTLKALIDMTGSEVAAAFSSGGSGNQWILGPASAQWEVVPNSLYANLLRLASTTSQAPVDDITVASEGGTEQLVVRFQELLPDQSITLDGVRLTASSIMSPAEVATWFSTRLTNWSVVGSPYTDSLDLKYVGNLAQTPDPVTALEGQTEKVAVICGALEAGQTFNVGSISITATQHMSASEVAAAVEAASGPTSNPGWSFESLSGVTLTYQSTTPTANVTDLVVSAAGRTEVATVTFASLGVGETATVAGRTLTASTALDASQVADIFAGADPTGHAAWQGQFEGWDIRAGGHVSGADTVTFTSLSDARDVTDLSAQVVRLDTSGAPEAATDLDVQTIAGIPAPEAWLVQTVQGVAIPVVETVNLPAVTAPTLPGVEVTQGVLPPAMPIVNNTDGVAIVASMSPMDTQDDSLPDIDILHGFSVGEDRLVLPTGAILSDPTGEAFDWMGLSAPVIDHGVAQFPSNSAQTLSTYDKIYDLLDASVYVPFVVAFVEDDGNGGHDTYVLWSDGQDWPEASDIVVKLAGVSVTDLSAILG